MRAAWWRSLAIAVLLFPAAGRSQNCAQTSIGRVPLTDLGAGLYIGQYQGGLYPGGSNAMPPAHLAAGLVAAAQIVPRNPAGAPDAQSGKIVLLAVGMSNAAGEFCLPMGTTGCWPESFMGQAALDAAVNHATLVMINGARPQQDTKTWVDPGGANYDAVGGLLAAQGLGEAQVQAVWLKEANINPPATLPSENADARVLEGRLGSVARALKTRYPNLRQIFFSTRIYAGYSVTPLSPEPSAYEGGFGVKWLIESQIDQMATPLNPIDPVAGDVNDTTVAPWLGWGPYLWADGTTPRSDGLTWDCSEFLVNEGAHLQQFAIRKVGAMLLDFLKTSPVTQTWFPAVPASDPQAPTVTIGAPADGTVVQPGDPIAFSGSATDADDGDLTANLVWTSSIDGPIGSGSGLTTSTLSLGTHWITASVVDTSGRTGLQTIHVTVPATTAAFRSVGTEDGYVAESPPGSGVGGYAYSTFTTLNVGDQANDSQVKMVLSFDTSSLPDDAVILGATLRLKRVGYYGSTGFDSLGRLLVDVQTGSFGGSAALQTSDFQAAATAPAVGSLNDPATNGDLWSIGSIDAAGLAGINKTGRTQVRIGFELPDNANAVADRTVFASGEDPIAAQRPELDVTYLSSSPAPTTSTSTVLPTTSSTSTTTSTSSATTSTSSTTTSPPTTTSTSTMPATTTTSTTSSSTTSTTLAGTTATIVLRSIGAEDGSLGESAPGSGVGGSINATSTTMQVGDQANNAQSRVIASFDTSTIPAGASITSATLRFNRVGLSGANPFGTLGRLLADVQSGGFGGSTALQASDFQAAATAPASASLSNPATNGAWSTGALDAAGLAALNRTGRTQVRLAFEVHDNANAISDRIQLATGEQADATLRPELDVTYSVPSSTTTTAAPTTTTTTAQSSTTTSTDTSVPTTTSTSTSSSTSTTVLASTTTTSTSSSTTSTTIGGTPVTLVLRSIGPEDGVVGESAPGSGVGGSTIATGPTMQVGDQASNAQSKVIASFDTSTIPAGATIVSATLRLNRTGLSGANPFATLGRLLADVQTGSFGGNAALQAGDFQALATAPASASLSNPATNGAWSTGTLDAAGLAAINRSGRTQVRLAFELHDNANAIADRIQFATGEHADASLWPALDVTYSQ